MGFRLDPILGRKSLNCENRRDRKQWRLWCRKLVKRPGPLFIAIFLPCWNSVSEHTVQRKIVQNEKFYPMKSIGLVYSSPIDSFEKPCNLEICSKPTRRFVCLCKSLLAPGPKKNEWSRTSITNSFPVHSNGRRSGGRENFANFGELFSWKVTSEDGSRLFERSLLDEPCWTGEMLSLELSLW